LVPVSQQLLSYVSPSQTPFLYQIIFNSSVANLAAPIQGLDFFDVQVTDAFEFYKNTSNEFVRAGYAANIISLPVPMKFDVPERIYKFPLSANSTPDSSISQLEIQYPSLVYFSLYKKRVNTVDGSGTLVTPYGTFSTLRLKSTIYERDSLYIDSLQTGVPIIREITEYKWLNPSFEAPLLTISQEGPFYSVQYIDFFRNIIPFTVDLGDDVTICQGDAVELQAVVAGGNAPYSYVWSTLETTSSIIVSPETTTTYTVSVLDNNGNFIFDEVQVVVVPFDRISLGQDTALCAEHSIEYNINGDYDEITWFINDVQKATGPSFSLDSTSIGLNPVVLRVDFRQNDCMASDEINITFHTCDAIDEVPGSILTISPTPATNDIIITNTQSFTNPKVFIYSLSGNNLPVDYLNTKGRLNVNVKDLSRGVYFIRIEDANKIYVGKVIKL
ncbi:MAG: T9SS type A sorting domain-containing protein, partial [Chloroflexota bacterium]